MSDHKFDRLLSDIRNEAIDDRVVAEASDRVWNSLSASPSAQFSVQKLRSCEDFQALIPAYLEKALPEARGLLFQDHVHQCVACRRAVEQARRGEMQIVQRPAWRADRQTDRHPGRQTDRQIKTVGGGFPVWRWAMSAA